MGNKRVDVLGKRFGKLLVIATSDKKHGSAPMYECRCDCGNITYRTSTQLRATSRPRCFSCLNDANKGVSRYEAGETGFNSLFCSYKSAARRRELPFELSREEFRELTQKDCYYCGDEPSKLQYGSYGFTKEHGVYKYNGVDRIDSNLGYTLNNVVPCCHTCNIMKGTQTLEDFIERCRKVVKFIDSQ